MDLRLTAAEPTAAERAAVDAVLDGAVPAAAGSDLQRAAAGGRIEVGGARARRSVRHLLLPALHGVQDAIGWISPAALTYVSSRLAVPPAEAYGVATFYALLSTTERPPRVAHVCDDIVCRGAGAEAICSGLEQRLGAAHHPGAEQTNGEQGAGPGAAWMTSPCLGLCERAPAVLLQLADDRDGVIAPATPEAVCAALTGSAGASGQPAAAQPPAGAGSVTGTSAPQTARPAAAS